MRKRVGLLLVVLAFLVSALGVVQAADLKWYEVGNGKYDVYDNGGFFFVENVDYANWKALTSKNLLSAMKPQDAIKQVKLRTSTVKAWKDGKLVAEPAVHLETVFANGAHNDQFAMKSLWNNNRAALIPDTSFGAVFQIGCAGNSFFLYHENGIESVQLSEKGSIVLKHLTLDKVDGTSWQQLKDPHAEGERLVWVEKPCASIEGNYVAYKSNKTGYAKGTTDKEIWLVDVKKGTDELRVNGTAVSLYGWVSDTVLVYALNSKNYFYDVLTEQSTALPEKSSILYVTAGYVVYLFPSDLRQVYLLDVKNQKEYAMPRLPENSKCYNSFYSIFFSLSPDGKKLAVFTQEQYNKGKQAEKAIFILDHSSNTATKVNNPGGLKPGESIFHLDQWVDNDNLVVYTQRPVESDQGPFEYRTWLVAVE